MDTFTLILVGQMLGAGLVAVGVVLALWVIGKVLDRAAVTAASIDGVAQDEGPDDLAVVDAGVPGFHIEFSRSDERGMFEIRIMGRVGGQMAHVPAMTVQGRNSMEDGFSVRLPGGDWEPVQDPVGWAMTYCSMHKAELLAAVEALK